MEPYTHYGVKLLGHNLLVLWSSGTAHRRADDGRHVATVAVRDCRDLQAVESAIAPQELHPIAQFRKTSLQLASHLLRRDRKLLHFSPERLAADARHLGRFAYAAFAMH